MSIPLAAVLWSITKDGNSSTVDPSVDSLGIDAGIEPRSLELVQFASRPLLAALAIALALAFYVKETYPKSEG